MSTKDPSQTTLLALSVHQEMGESFAKDVTGGAEAAKLAGHSVAVEILSGDPRLNAAWDDSIHNADGIALLIRFMDVISMDKIKAIYRRIPSEDGTPLVTIIIRENSESDFKMSCPVCGQKLWVRDSDAGKRGRCPNCKKAFTLPDQVSHVRSQLTLPDSVPVVRVNSGQPESAVAAVEGLLKAVGGGLIEPPEDIDQAVLKQSTMRVSVSPEDLDKDT